MSDAILPLTETVSPAGQAALCETVAAAMAADTPVYPLGGRTNLGYGANRLADERVADERGGPLPPGLGICTEKLNRVIDHAEGDLTVTVEAGVTIARLAKLLAAKNQRLPVDVPRPQRATIGGVVARGQAGPRRFSCGTMRDYVIGFRAVDGTGTPFAGGGRVVKNVAGYDMCRLITGSLGTLGLITQVTLMVKPLPRRSAFLACGLPDFDIVERMLADLVQSKTLPAAVELLAGPAWQNDPALGPQEGDVARLLVGFEGSPADVQWMLDTLGRQWQQALGRTPTAVHKSQVDPLWSRLAEFPLAEESSGPLVVQIGTLPSATVALVQQIRQLAPRVSVQAHAGDGIIRARFPIEPDSIESGSVTKLLEADLRPVVAAAGGRMVVLAYPPQAKLDRKSVWGPDADRAADGIGVMRAIKDRFDPKGLLNPGRFIF